MEKLVGKLLVATGLLICGAVAGLPLASYAITGEGNIYYCGQEATSVSAGVDAAEKPKECAKSGDTATEIYVNVKDILAFDATAGAGFTNKTGSDTKVTLFPNIVGHGQIYAKIRSARPYTISLSATPDTTTGVVDTFLANEDESAFIPARNNPAQGTNGWGIANGVRELSDEVYNADYKALKESPEVFYTSEANDDFITTYFPVAVSVNDKIPQGTYTANVTITAAVSQ